MYYVGLYIHHSCNYEDKFPSVNCSTFTRLHVGNYGRRYVARNLHTSESLTAAVHTGSHFPFIWNKRRSDFICTTYQLGKKWTWQPRSQLNVIRSHATNACGARQCVPFHNCYLLLFLHFEISVISLCLLMNNL